MYIGQQLDTLVLEAYSVLTQVSDDLTTRGRNEGAEGYPLYDGAALQRERNRGRAGVPGHDG